MSKPADPAGSVREGDRVIVSDPVRVGDLVYFKRIGPADVIVHSGEADDECLGRVCLYRAFPGAADGQVRFVRVEGHP